MNTSTDTTVAVLADDAIAAVAEFIEVKALINTLSKKSDALKAVIADALGDAKTGVTPDGEVAVRVSDRERESVNLEVLKKFFPKAWDATGRTTPYTVYLT
jgi:predicted phage-related endonuclease